MVTICSEEEHKKIHRKHCLNTSCKDCIFNKINSCIQESENCIILKESEKGILKKMY